MNVLLVTYSFPPAGGVGVLRASSLARYLPAEDIRLDVLTTRNASAVGLDQGLLDKIPSEVVIHRTFTFDLPFGLKKAIKRLIATGKTDATNIDSQCRKPGFIERVLQNLLLPDPQVTWMPMLVHTAYRIIRDREIDLVLITVPPFSTMMLVKKLRERFPNLPTVIDFRDEWLSSSLKLISFNKSEEALRIACDTEATAMRSASTVVTVTKAAQRVMRLRYPKEPEGKFQMIPNGFDARPALPTKDRQGKFVLTYVGSLYKSTDPTWFVEAVSSLPPEVRSMLKLRFIGHIEDAHYRESLLRLGDTVELKGFLPQSEALDLTADTDALLMISHDAVNVPAKFYDYISLGRPILATVNPGGDARHILEELKAGWWADSYNTMAIRRLLINVIVHGESMATSFRPDPEKIAQYERGALTKRYATLLHSIAKD